MKLTEWTTVVPAPGEVKSTARALLALARHPGDVRTSSGGAEFLVPPYLADLYNAPPAPPPVVKTVEKTPEPPRSRRRTKKEGDE